MARRPPGPNAGATATPVAIPESWRSRPGARARAARDASGRHGEERRARRRPRARQRARRGHERRPRLCATRHRAVCRAAGIHGPPPSSPPSSIGDRAGLTEDVQRRLQEAGTYHVIAISGGNIAILAGLLLAMFRVAGWLGRGAMLAAIAALLAYARLVGDSASVDRATLMAVVLLRRAGRRSAQPAAQCAGGRGGGAGRRRSAVGGGPGIHPDVRRHAGDPRRRAGCRQRLSTKSRDAVLSCSFVAS